jgi:glutamine synthetase
LEANTALCQAVGAEFCAEFIRLKRAEWDAFSLQVSDWELRHYADAF